MSTAKSDDVPEALPEASAETASRPEPPSPRAKHLTLAEPPELVPARMINELLYCERLMFLEWARGEFTDNAYTVEGRAVHRRADQAGSGLKAPRRRAPAGNGEPEPAEPELPYTARAVWLSSERLAITARIDVVDVEGGLVIPIEYKRGKKPKLPEGAYLPERAQLCAQVLLLREHGFRCEEAHVYFAADRQRVSIAIDAELERITLEAAKRARAVASANELPSPLVDSPKCRGCSLAGICLPDETVLLRALESDPSSEAAVEPNDDANVETASASADAAATVLRRLHPARDDTLPLYVHDQGARIGVSGEVLVVNCPDAAPVEARLANTSQVCVFGNVQVSTQALRALMERGIPVVFFTYGGWFVGRATGTDTKNVDLRLAQYERSLDPAFCLNLARRTMVSKIANCRTMLRRNHSRPDDVVLWQLKQLARKASEAECLESLLGIEGTAARAYFGEFTGMLKPGGDDSLAFDLAGRNRRPPKDPINALLSFSYALLAKDWVTTVASVGLDPLLGFYHQPRFGRPALALDLMEEFRPIVADSVVLGAVNNAVVTEGDFITAATGVALTQTARRRVILAYERRMDQLATHPVFGYRISYRRILEVQARLLAKLCLGEIKSYPTYQTR
jgi:CRISP-associated protein Cas1